MIQWRLKALSAVVILAVLLSSCTSREIPWDGKRPDSEVIYTEEAESDSSERQTQESGSESESYDDAQPGPSGTLPAPVPGTATEELSEDDYPERMFDSSTLGVDSAAYCVLRNDGQVLIGRNDLKAYAPASITKVLSALVVMEHVNLSEKVTIQESSVTYNLETMSSGVYPSFKPGETVTVEDLLYALILESTNAAGNILADYVAGSTAAFAEMMNQKAKSLGAVNSHFVNAHGLDQEGHYSCAYDMTLILRAAFSYDPLRVILQATKYTIPATEYTPSRTIYMGHQIVNGTRYFPKIVAGKPGWTVNAQGTLLSVYEGPDAWYYICTMCSDNGNQYEDTLNLAEFASASVEGREPVLTPLAHNMTITSVDDTGVDLYYNVENGGVSSRIVYWDLLKGTSNAIFGPDAGVKPTMGVHLSLPYHGAFQVQIFVTDEAGEERGLSFFVLYTGRRNAEGIKDWNGKQYIIDENGLLKYGGGVSVPEGHYYVSSDGTIAHGFCGRFYAGEDGQIMTGWITAEGATFFCQADGRIATGTLIIEGVKYEFSESGTLLQGIEE